MEEEFFLLLQNVNFDYPLQMKDGSSTFKPSMKAMIKLIKCCLRIDYGPLRLAESDPMRVVTHDSHIITCQDMTIQGRTAK